MESNHFKYFRIRNFKRFKNLEISDIGQFNLILGDNNVGKTSLLEALLFPNTLSSSTIHKFIGHLYKALDYRNYSGGKVNFWRYYLPADFYYAKNIDPVSFRIETENHNQFGLSLSTDQSYNSPNTYLIQDEENATNVSFHSVEHHKNNSDIPFIPFQGSFSEEIAEFYLNYMQGNKKLKQRFIKALSELFDDIEDIEPSLLDNNQKTLLVNRSNFNYSIPLAFYGEGTIKLTKILSHIIRHSGNQVMIDEIDTGIYHSRMKTFWRIVFEISIENNTQIFATTHNLECIKAYQEALEEIGIDFQNRSRTISLVENKTTKEVSSVTYSFDEFQHSLMVGNEIR